MEERGIIERKIGEKGREQVWRRIEWEEREENIRVLEDRDVTGGIKK